MPALQDGVAGDQSPGDRVGVVFIQRQPVQHTLTVQQRLHGPRDHGDVDMLCPWDGLARLGRMLTALDGSRTATTAAPVVYVYGPTSKPPFWRRT